MVNGSEVTTTAVKMRAQLRWYWMIELNFLNWFKFELLLISYI